LKINDQIAKWRFRAGSARRDRPQIQPSGGKGGTQGVLSDEKWLVRRLVWVGLEEIRSPVETGIARSEAVV
jgi:hypothetical protein